MSAGPLHLHKHCAADGAWKAKACLALDALCLSGERAVEVDEEQL